MNIKNKIKEALNSSESLDINDELLWNKIEHKLPKKEKKRRYFLILFTTISIGIISIGIYNKNHFGFHHSYNSAQSIKGINNKEKSAIIIQKENASQIQNAASTNLYSKIKTISTNQKSPIRLKAIKLLESENQSSGALLNNAIDNTSDSSTENFHKIESEINSNNNLVNVSPINTIGTKSLEKNILLPDLQLQIPSNRITVVSEKLKQWSVESEAFVGLLHRRLDLINRNDELYYQQKKASEIAKELFASQLLLSFKINKVSISSGIKYLQLNEVFIGREDIRTNTKVHSDSAYYYITQGNYHYLPGELNKTIVNGKKIYSPNALVNWQIPLLLKYDIIKYHTLNVQSTIGINYSFLQYYRGISFGDDNEIKYNDNNHYKKIYKSSGLYSWQFGLSIDKKIITGLHTIVHINYLGTGNVLQKNISINQKYQTYGLGIGLRYFLK